MKKEKTMCIGLLAALAFLPIDAFATSKSETVYTNLNYDGTPEKTVVSNHLSFVGDSDIEDETILKDIMNIKGEEEFSQKEDKLTWKNRGNDIFYKGSTDKSHPIKTEIVYYLDGKESAIEDIIGSSGHIKITYNFTNDSKNYMSINGYMETIYTPFLTTVASIIKDDAKNITITNGKLVNTGSRTVALGFASPGLYASTKLSNFKNFDSITIEFDTDNFTLGTNYIISTPKLLSDSDTSILDEFSSISKSIKTLETGMTKIEDGAKELENGATTLLTGSNTLTKSISQAKSSMDNLKNGSVSLDKGIAQILEALNTTKSGFQSPDYMKKVSDLQEFHTENAKLISKLSQGLNAAGLSNEVLLNSCLTKDSYFQSNENVQLFCLINGNDQAIQGSLSTTNDLLSKIDELITGVTSLKEGASKLTTGLGAMNTGLDKIYVGAKTLSAGTETLKVGTSTLKKGTTEFKTQGIDKLVDYANSLNTYSSRAKALVKMSKDYEGFASSNSDDTIFISMVKSYK